MKAFVKDMKDKQSVDTVLLIREKNLQTGKTGKPYIALTLADKTGTIDGRVWENAEEADELLEPGEFIHIKGFAKLFQNRMQLTVNKFESIESHSVDIRDFLPASKRPPEDMFNELMELVATVKNPFVKDLITNTLSDPEIKPLILACPAAKTIHHSYLGGLLEHILSISRLMVKVADHYKILDFDLLLFGAIYHDIGKIWELSYETSFGYTDVGRLVGHIPLGSELVEKKSSEIPNFPYELKNLLKHIVLSHHNLLEYGSPKRPKFLEALVVAYIDDLDSKVNALEELIRSERDAGHKWTKYSKMYDRYFFTGTLKDED